MDPVLVSLTEEKSFPLKRPSIFIGRDQWRVDIRLPDDAVEDVHCELIRQETGFRLVNFSESGTLVNGKPVSQAVIRDGDELTIASHRMRLFCAAAPVELTSEISPAATDLSIEARWSALNISSSDTESATDALPTPVPTELKIAPTRTTPLATPEETTPETVVEPQFFVMLGGHETGPLPLQAVEQLALDHRITIDTRVKAEGADHWSVAAGLNIDIPPPAQADALDQETQDDDSNTSLCPVPLNAAQRVIASSAWLLLSPVFYISSCVRALSALSPGTLVGGTAMTIALTAALLFWCRGWTQTALTGTLTLDGSPLAAVRITLTGKMTGSSAVGFTDSHGRFSARTLDGNLAPGRYHITLDTLSEVPAEEDPKREQFPVIPRKYLSVGSSDAVIDITSDQTDYEIAVTTTTQQSGDVFGTEQ